MMKWKGPTKHFRTELPNGYPDEHRWDTLYKGMRVPERLEDKVKKEFPECVEEEKDKKEAKKEVPKTQQDDKEKKQKRKETLFSKTVAELKKIAKSLGIPRYYGMKEEELVKAIMKAEAK